MKKLVLLVLAMVTLVPVPSIAAEFDPTPLIQAEFKDLSRDVGLAAAFQPLAPAAPLGLVGFDIGVSAVATKLDKNASYLVKALGAGNVPSYLILPRLQVAKGLPLGIDVGGIYAKDSKTDISLWGLEAKYALLEGGAVSPAVALRGSYSQLSGMKHWDLSTMGLGLLVSKGFVVVTPYAGYNITRISSKPSVTGLAGVSLNEGAFLAGARFSLGVMNLVAEADFGKVQTYSLKFAFGL